MFYFVDFKIDKNKTSQYPVIKYQIHPVYGIVKNYPVLAADKSKTFAKFQKEVLKVIN